MIMKKIAFFCILTLAIYSCNNKVDNLDSKSENKESKIDSVSYCIGVLYSNYLYNEGLQKIDYDEFELGMNNYINNDELRFDLTESRGQIIKFIEQFADTSNNLSQENVDYSNLKDLSYCLGLDISNNIISQYNLDISVQNFNKGFFSKFKSEESWITVEDAGVFFDKFLSELQIQEQKEQEIANADILLKNKKTLENMSGDKVVLESGIEIEILNEGEGDSPKLSDVVKVHYEGKLENGNVFDSSLERGDPVEFPLSQVIPGWIETLQLMKVGSKWNVSIPSELAYGENGIPEAGIPGNSTLIFEIELLQIN